MQWLSSELVEAHLWVEDDCDLVDGVVPLGVEAAPVDVDCLCLLLAPGLFQSALV